MTFMHSSRWPETGGATRDPNLARKIPWRILVALAGLLLLTIARADEEPPPRIPGPDADMAVPDADAIAALEQRLAPDRVQKFAYTQACIEGVRRKGGSGASSFGNWQAFAHAALPECGLHLNYETFAAFQEIHDLDPGAVLAYLDKCLLVSYVLDRRHDQTDEVRLASAYGRLAHAWGRLLRGAKVDSARVVKAAQTVSGDEAARSVPARSWRGFVVAAVRASDASLSAWATSEVERIVAESPDDPELAELSLAAELSRAIALASTNPRDAKARLSKLLPTLAAEGALPSSSSEMIGLYNRAVTAALRLKLRIKATYRTTGHRTTGSLLFLELPRAVGWTDNRVDGDQLVGEFERRGPDHRRTVVRVWRYKTSIDYVDEDGTKIGGDNVGGRAKAFFRSAKAEMLKVRRANPRIRSCSKSLRKTRGFEVTGTTVDEGELLELRIREWYFKTEQVDGWALNVCAREYGESLADDPELAFILSTLREPPQK